MRELGRLEPWARPGTNPDQDEATDDATADAVALPGLIQSPMKTSAGAGAATKTRLDNANTKALAGGFATADIDTDVNNGFTFPKLSAALTVPVPKTPSIGAFDGRKVTFRIVSRGTAGDTVTFTTGANGFRWPTTGIGPFQSDFDATLAAMTNDQVIEVAASYYTAGACWFINSLAGPFTP
jgi:hypothetical protein